MALDIDKDAPAPIPQPIGTVKTIKRNIGELNGDQGVFAELGIVLEREPTTEEYYNLFATIKQLFPVKDAGLLAVFELQPREGKQIDMVSTTTLRYADPPKQAPEWTEPETEPEEY